MTEGVEVTDPRGRWRAMRSWPKCTRYRFGGQGTNALVRAA
jgi:hypothetical protein